MPQKADGGEWGEPNMPQLLNPDGSDPFEVDLVHKHSNLCVGINIRRGGRIFGSINMRVFSKKKIPAQSGFAHRDQLFLTVS